MKKGHVDFVSHKINEEFSIITEKTVDTSALSKEREDLINKLTDEIQSDNIPSEETLNSIDARIKAIDKELANAAGVEVKPDTQDEAKPQEDEEDDGKEYFDPKKAAGTTGDLISGPRVVEQMMQFMDHILTEDNFKDDGLFKIVIPILNEKEKIEKIETPDAEDGDSTDPNDISTAEGNNVDTEDQNKWSKVLNNFVDKYLKTAKTQSTLRSSPVLTQKLAMLSDFVKTLSMAIVAPNEPARIKVFQDFKNAHKN